MSDPLETILRSKKSIERSIKLMVDNELHHLEEAITSLRKEISSIDKDRFSSKLIAIEGERTSGKDTLLSNLKNHYGDNFVVIDKCFDQTWNKLVETKQNMYFQTDNNLLVILLWCQNLLNRIENVYSVDFPKNNIIAMNRYIHSFFILNRCLFDEDSELIKKQVEKLLNLIISIVPEPLLTIILDVDYKTVINRLWQFRKRILTVDEDFLLKKNLVKFKNTTADNIIHIDTDHSNPAEITQTAIKAINIFSKNI